MSNIAIEPAITPVITPIMEQKIELLERAIAYFSKKPTVRGICNVLDDLTENSRCRLYREITGYISQCLGSYSYHSGWLYYEDRWVLENYCINSYGCSYNEITPYERDKMFTEARIAWMQEMIRLLKSGVDLKGN